MGDPRYVATVNCDVGKWVAIPPSWGGDVTGAKKWADAEAARRWDAWSAQHPDVEHPGSVAVERTALELKVVRGIVGECAAGGCWSNWRHCPIPPLCCPPWLGC